MTYSFMVIQQIIENTHLREQLAHHQQLQAWYASREKLVLEVTELTEKVIKTVNEAVSPTNRLN